MRFWMCVAAIAALAAAPAQATVDYAIDLSAPEHHTGQVRIAFPVAEGPHLDVRMPAWRAGRYNILNLANGVSRFAATDAAGRPLRWQKVDKSTWRIHLDRPTAVRVGYEIYGNELGLRTRHIDDSHAYLNNSAVFMYADRFRGEDVAVALKTPPGWRSYSGMDAPATNRFVAANWDVLIDSPIETGVSEEVRFREGERDYQIVVWGKGNHDLARMRTDFAKFIAQAPSVWSGYPFRRYLFIVHATDGAGGATEHLNSTVIQLPRYAFGDPATYLRFLTTAAHEFIHTWNVKAYRAQPMMPYDYQQENYSDLLWLHEGSTDYFAKQFVVRAGLAPLQHYFGQLAESIAARRPGRRVQSVAESSFDQWIAPANGDLQQNAWVDIYEDGALASLRLDLALVAQSGGRVSYRDVHRLLYDRFGSGKRGFTRGDMLAILRELTGQSWDAWWAANIDAPSTPDYSALLAPVGLTLAAPPATKAMAGWSGAAADGGIRLSTVERDGPAWRAGLTRDDVIVAIDGQRMTEGRFQAIMAERAPGATVTVSFFRRDQLMQKRVRLGAAPAGPVKLQPVANPSASQRALFERWLLVPFPG